LRKFKILIKNIFDFVFELLHRFSFLKHIVSNYEFNIYKTNRKHTFFGYFDKSPFSFDDTKLLFISTDYNKNLTTPELAYIGYFDLKSKSYVEIDSTTTWCWQQGCRLMWYDKDLIIYNKVVNDNYGSVLFDISKNKIVSKFNFPIYDINPCEKIVLSLNFSRLQYFRPGYGYSNFINSDDREKRNIKDGVFLCSLEDDKKKLLISFEKIINSDYKESMNNASHYINHLKFSPDGLTFIFYHIWVNDNKRYTRIIYSDLKGNILNILDNNTFMSHDTFFDNNSLLVFTKTKLKGYHLYNLNNLNYKILSKQLNLDGHPSYLSKNNFITDTYPNKFSRYQRLLLSINDNITNVAKVYSPRIYNGEFRCDLHPRLNNSKDLVSIDIPFFSGRMMVIFKINK
jgi:hypothetical protein